MSKLNNDLNHYISLHYGIISNKSNLECDCDKNEECWLNYRQYSSGELQKPYVPWIGELYNGLLFAGINFNGGNTSINYAISLKKLAVEEYLNHHKYLIFKQNNYRGSPFWYYLAILGYLYGEYYVNNKLYYNESDIDLDKISSGFDHCAFTNIIKCSTSNSDRSIPTDNMFSNCIEKYFGEVEILNPKIVFSFTRFSYPNLMDIFIKRYKKKDLIIISDNERARISKINNFFLIEVEHPTSTAISRVDKYKIYSESLYHALNKGL